MDTTHQTTSNKATPSETTTNHLWRLDPVHTTVGFSVRHLMIANVHGVFEQVAGSVSYDPSRPERAQIEVTIMASSVHTRDPQRDAHLRSADFFDAEAHPQITFRSTEVRRDKAGALEIIGELSIRGTTRPITLGVTEVTGEQRDFQGARRFGASARGKLRRSEFGISFNKVLETGAIAVGDEISLSIDASLVKVG
jgi:polyisoprenoid-binding protein YceI